MNRKQFEKACAIANQGGGSWDNIDRFNGFALNSFQPIICTLTDMIGLIKWQAIMLDGNVDTEALQEIWDNKRKFQIVG